MSLIALIEDDPQIRNTLEIGLKLKGLRIQSFSSAEALFAAVPPHALGWDRFDLFVIDLGLPGKTGAELCKQIRKKDPTKPILVISATTEESTAVNSFASGADDFVRKPFGLEELSVRIERLLGRAVGQKKLTRFEGLILDRSRRRASFKEEWVDLTATEFTILELLMARPNELVTRESIMQIVDEGAETQDRTLDSHISHIRKKLRSLGAETIQISSVYGQGYRLEAIQ